MTNVKCIRCGVVNSISNEVCKVCGSELRPAPAYTQDATPQPEPTPSGPPPIASISPFYGVGNVLGPTFSIFFKNLWLITKIVVVVAAPFEIFQALSVPKMDPFDHEWQLRVGTFGLQLLTRMLIAPALLYALLQVLQTGVAPSINESYRWGLSKLVKLSLCAGLAYLLEIFGFVLLIIPGIILLLAFTVVYPVAVLEKQSIVQTIKRSYDLTDGYKWRLLGAAIVLTIAFAVIHIPLGAMSAVFLVTGGDFWPAQALTALIIDIVDQWTTVFSLVVYLSILRTLE